MQITDPRFGAALVTRRGKTIKFDAVECMREYCQQASNAKDVASVWVSDFQHPGTMLDVNTARFVDLGPGRAPMGRGWVAVASDADAAALNAGPAKRWSDIQ
jgi:copper chaperone NosL